jgi:hypothetical protein
MRILLVHGVGHCDTNANYYDGWKQEIVTGLTAAGCTTMPPTFDELHYDDLFDKHSSAAPVYVAALTQLMASAAEHAVIDPIAGALHDIFHRTRGFDFPGDWIKWHVGMVAELVVYDELRAELHERLMAQLVKGPDIVAAHSLGSLLTYDFLRNDARARTASNFHYLTFGSQINNVFVRSKLWPGRITMPAGLHSWTHLYNPRDPVLTADIRIAGEPRFHCLVTNSPAGHSPTAEPSGPGYLDHPTTTQVVWPALAKGDAAKVARSFQREIGGVSLALAKPRRRALLIGINDYPDPANRLDGCVNDTFLVSAALQERGFDAEDVRVVLNERATAAAIRERLHWLLDGVDDGMERVLFYSGHGAQIPAYNITGVVDHVDECLVPYDFAWTRESAVTDKDFFRLYSDLPFAAKFFAIFDCCHAGGLTRDGSHKVRGISPPDDIRHRQLRWDKREQMWVDRDFASALNPHFGGSAEERREMMGVNGVTFRIGRGMELRRGMSKLAGKKLSTEGEGLFMPVILEACREDQLSFEYRHGATSYGAFTYSLVKTLRADTHQTFNGLMTRTSRTLKSLRYDQDPQLVGPTRVLRTRVPGG